MKKMISAALAKLELFVTAFKKNAEKLWSKFNNLSARERNISILAAAVVLLMFADAVVVRPLRQSIISLHQKIAEQEKKALRNLSAAAQKPDLDSIYSGLRRNIQGVAANDEEIRSSILNDIESFARSCEIYLLEVKPQVSSENGRFKEFSVRLQLEGRMEKLMQFFVEFIKTQKLYTVESFRITPHPEDVHKIKAAVSISRVVFR